MRLSNAKYPSFNNVYFGYYNPNHNDMVNRTSISLLPRSRSESSNLSARETARVQVSYDLITWRKSNIPITTNLRDIINLNQNTNHKRPLYQAFDQLDVNIYLSLDLVNWFIIPNPIKTVRMTNIYTINDYYYMIDFITNELYFSKDLEQLNYNIWTKAQFIPSLPYNEGINGYIKSISLDHTFYYLTTKNTNFHYISPDMKIWHLVELPSSNIKFNRIDNHMGVATILSLDHKTLYYSSDFKSWNNAHSEVLNDKTLNINEGATIKYYMFIGSFCIKCVQCSDGVIKWFATSDFNIWNEILIHNKQFTYISFEKVKELSLEKNIELYHAHGSTIEGSHKSNSHYLTTDFINWIPIQFADENIYINSVNLINDQCIIHANQSSKVYASPLNDLKSWTSITDLARNLIPDLSINDCDVHYIDGKYIISINYLRILMYSEDLKNLELLPLPKLDGEAYYTLKHTDLNVYALDVKDGAVSSTYISKNLRDWELVEVTDSYTHNFIRYRKLSFCHKYVIAYAADSDNVYYSSDFKVWNDVDITLYDSKKFRTIRYDSYGKYYIISSKDNKVHFISRDMKIWRYTDVGDMFSEVNVLTKTSNDFLF